LRFDEVEQVCLGKAATTTHQLDELDKAHVDVLAERAFAQVKARGGFSGGHQMQGVASRGRHANAI
jgi:hypothetical protein